MAHAFDIVDDRCSTGFDWEGEFGAKTIGEAFARVDGLALVRELRTPLYSVQLWRRLAGTEARPIPEVVSAPLDLPLPVMVEKTVIWDGAAITRKEARDSEQSSTVPILMYHSVAEEGPPELAPYRISPVLFEKHLQCLRRHGYHSISLEFVGVQHRVRNAGAGTAGDHNVR